MLPGASMSGFKGNSQAIAVIVSSSQNNINLFTVCSSPLGAGTYTITINAGVTIGSLVSTTAAIVTGTFPSGSIVNLVVNGSVLAKEGAGGGSDLIGNAGGHAISCSGDINISGAGVIKGGGGGGGGGSTTLGTDANGTSYSAPGGQGGDGQGFGNPGGPSAGAVGSTVTSPDGQSSVTGGAGFSGGAYGAAGAAGGYGGPGAAGNAVKKNGYTVNVAGPTTTGAVS